VPLGISGSVGSRWWAGGDGSVAGLEATAIYARFPPLSSMRCRLSYKVDPTAL
jgi:hypothetical protein